MIQPTGGNPGDDPSDPGDSNPESEDDSTIPEEEEHRTIEIPVKDEDYGSQDLSANALNPITGKPLIWNHPNQKEVKTSNPTRKVTNLPKMEDLG